MPETLHRLTDIGCLVRIAEETPMAAIRQAIALAAHARAHLGVTLAVQTFKPPYSPFWTSVTDDIANEVNAKTRSIAEKVAETARAEAKAAGVSINVEICSGAFADVAEHAANAARAVDLVVIDQPHGSFDTSEMLLEEALFHSGRPVLVASAEKPPIAEIDMVVIGWDGSSHAARAASDALFVFPSIRNADVLTVSGEKPLEGILPSERFAAHLKRKGIDTTLSTVEAKGRSVGQVLDDYAQNADADLLIMGGFGHSRLREFLLGGVTVELTRGAKTALLLAY